jgi:uncharacterized membrane protein
VDVSEGVEADEWVGPPRWRPVTAFVLSLVGFGLSMYLTIEHFQNGHLPCPANTTISCLKVTTSSVSEVFGIFPVALLGLIFYTAMVPIMWPRLWYVRQRWVSWARLAMVVSGVAFVLYLLGEELFNIKAICLWCTGVHVTTFLIFVLVVSSLPSSSAGEPGGDWATEDDGDYDAQYDDADTGDADDLGPADSELEVR